MAAEVVIGATGKILEIRFVDNAGAALNITGATVKLQGQSPDLPGFTLNVAGAVFDAPLGKARWTALGSTPYPQLADLEGKPSATFNLRGELTLSGVDYTPVFEVMWVPGPLA